MQRLRDEAGAGDAGQNSVCENSVGQTRTGQPRMGQRHLSQNPMGQGAGDHSTLHQDATGAAARLVYYSSRSQNTHRFVERLGLAALRLPLGDGEPMPAPAGPFVLITPTYADGQGRGAVPRPVIRFLNAARTRGLLRGVIASGNRNFGTTFAMAGDVVAAKCGVPVLYRFELAGTDGDVGRVLDGLDRFWKTQCLTAT